MKPNLRRSEERTMKTFMLLQELVVMIENQPLG